MSDLTIHNLKKREQMNGLFEVLL